MKQNYLLPFKAQLTGWILLPLSFIIFFILSFFSLKLLPNNWDFFSISVLQHLSLFLICFSREKKEDEYLSFLRGRSIFITAVIFGIIMIIRGVTASAFTYGVIPLNDASCFRCMGVMLEPRLMLLIYIVVYKTSLCISTIKSRKNEE